LSEIIGMRDAFRNQWLQQHTKLQSRFQKIPLYDSSVAAI